MLKARESFEVVVCRVNGAPMLQGQSRNMRFNVVRILMPTYMSSLSIYLVSGSVVFKTNRHALKFPVKILTKKVTIEKLVFGWDTKNGS